ncbi:MAG: hypothetical protein ACON5B_08845 [Myxococcota bacterium]
MRQWVGMALLVVGVSVAGAFGARNSEQVTTYRQSLVDTEGPSVQMPTPSERFWGWLGESGAPWGLGVVLIVAGGMIARRDASERAASPTSGADGHVDFLGALEAMETAASEALHALASCEDEDDAPEVREALDRLRFDVLTPMVDRRGVLLARHGMSDFAEYFGSYSGAERQLNRAWSALTDGHVPTARTALQSSRQSVEMARSAYKRADARLSA